MAGISTLPPSMLRQSHRYYSKHNPRHVRQPRPTHFLSLPLVTPASHPQLQASLSQYRDEVCNKLPLTLHSNIVCCPGSIHLTLGIMEIRDPARLRQAIEHLPHALDGVQLSPNAPPLSVTLRSLKAMKSAITAKVLYAEPYDETGRLEQLAERLRASFVEAGLVESEEGRPLMLHATVLNTRNITRRVR